MLPVENSIISGSPALTPSVRDNYFDQNSLNVVKSMGRKNDPQALKEIAKKFEGMFVQQMLKSMRDANAVFEDSDLFSSDEMKFHQEMMDQQMVVNLTSGKGIGLADVFYKQMSRMHGASAVSGDLTNKGTVNNELVTPAKSNSLPVQGQVKSSAVGNGAIPPLISRSGIKASIAETPEEFVAKLMPYAKKAAAELNVKPDVILAQAALETGWGKHLIHDAQGNNSFNIFNIKSTGWQGKSVSVTSVENRNGVAQQEKSGFRQYDNYLQSFVDYVKLIKNNPRYEKALAAGGDSAGYADALQAAGYATDPSYADKIKALLSSDTIQSAVKSSITLASADTSVQSIADVQGAQS